MITICFLFAIGIGGAAAAPTADFSDAAAAVPLVLHTYEVRFRLDGRVSTTQVQANDAGQAKKLVKAQYGDKVTVLSAKRVD